MGSEMCIRDRCRSTAGCCCATLRYSSPQDRSSLVFGRCLCQPGRFLCQPGRCSCQPLGCSTCLAFSLSAPCCCTRERDCREIFFIWITGASGWAGLWRWPRSTRSAGRLGTWFECKSVWRTFASTSRVRRSCLEVETGGSRKFSFLGMMQENSKTLLRPTTLQQPTGPLRPCLRALLVSARPLLVSAPWMPDVPRFLSLGPVLLCQGARLPSSMFYLDYGGLRMDRSLGWPRCTRSAGRLGT